MHTENIFHLISLDVFKYLFFIGDFQFHEFLVLRLVCHKFLQLTNQYPAFFELFKMAIQSNLNPSRDINGNPYIEMNNRIFYWRERLKVGDIPRYFILHDSDYPPIANSYKFDDSLTENNIPVICLLKNLFLSDLNSNQFPRYKLWIPKSSYLLFRFHLKFVIHMISYYQTNRVKRRRTKNSETTNQISDIHYKNNWVYHLLECLKYGIRIPVDISNDPNFSFHFICIYFISTVLKANDLIYQLVSLAITEFSNNRISLIYSLLNPNSFFNPLTILDCNRIDLTFFIPLLQSPFKYQYLSILSRCFFNIWNLFYTQSLPSPSLCIGKYMIMIVYYSSICQLTLQYDMRIIESALRSLEQFPFINLCRLKTQNKRVNWLLTYEQDTMDKESYLIYSFLCDIDFKIWLGDNNTKETEILLENNLRIIANDILPFIKNHYGDLELLKEIDLNSFLVIIKNLRRLVKKYSPLLELFDREMDQFGFKFYF